jgi:DNA polymerase-3 subunit chi
MTRVDFYVLQPGSRGNRYTLAVRLAEKAWNAGHRVLIATASSEDLRHMDRLLWTFRDQNFIPHGVLGDADPSLNPVLVTDREEPGNEHDVLINLRADIPDFFSRFERVAECVDQEQIQLCRDHYRFYQDCGYQLNTYKIGD